MDMDIDIDALVGQTTGWDLRVKVNKTKYRVNAPTLGEVIQLEEALSPPAPGSAKKSSGSLLAVMKLLMPEAPVETWKAAQLTGVLTAIMTYSSEYARKNSQASAATISAEVKRLATPPHPPANAAGASS